MPEVQVWNIPTLTNAENGFHDWRETFDNQVGSVCLQLDVVLVALRDEKEFVDNDRFLELLSSTSKLEKLMDAHAADWAFSFVSRRLFSVLDAYFDGEAKKFLKEVKDTNGLEAYRLLNVNYDPMNSDTEFELQQTILAMARWMVKGLAPTEAMIREKSKTVATLERRIGHSVSAELMGLFTGQAFGLLDEVMKKEIRRTEGARENFPKMRVVIKRLRRDEILSKPRSMSIGSLAESEWGEDFMSQWNWEQDWLAAGGSWEEEAAPEPRESLDALGKG